MAGRLGSFLCRIAACAAAAAVLALGVTAGAVSGNDLRSDYKLITYDYDTGLETFEINDIVQTADGFIWAGSYSGLLRYDGGSFEDIDLGAEISNVRRLFVDSGERLWIGTNDSGIFRYNTVTGELVQFTSRDGLGADTIRSICEDDKGRIYIGTAGALTIISPEGELSTVRTEGMVNIDCLDFADGVMCAVTAAGNVFFSKNGVFNDTPLTCPQSGVYYTQAQAVGGGWYIGTSDGKVMKYSGSGEPELICDQSALGSITCMLPYGGEGGCFICAYGGFGFLEKNGEFTELSGDAFRSSVSAVMVDNQDNIWLASDKLGISKLSPNPFENCFALAELSDKVVNALLKSGGMLYVGCDDGLFVLDDESGRLISNPLSDMLSGIRIRHIMQDSTGKLWISTYGGDGLLCVNTDGSTRWYSETNSGAVGTRFRSSIELKDGTIVAASSMGITFIRGGEVVGALGAADGLKVPQILTMVEREDGSILAGSDGDGIYIIEDGRLTGRIDENNGLETSVILRIVECGSGYIYITSNALYYDDGSEVHRLTSFPYNNNYDICNVGDGELWVSSSRGIFIVNEEDLVGNGDYDYVLLNRNRGFDTTLTANSWSFLDEDGYYYLCCSDGVRKISVKNYNEINGHYELAVKSVFADDTASEYDPASMTYTVPAGINRIVIHPAVLNFSLTNPMIRMYMEGFDTSGITVQQSELMPMTYTNLPGGSYLFHIQVLDEHTGEVSKEIAVNIVKKKAFYEHRLFVFLCIAVFCAVVAMITLVIAKLNSVKVLRQQYEETRKAKDEAEQATRARGRFLANMSHEIRTPINTIMGMNEMILRESEDPAISEYAGNIKNAGKTLLDLVDNVLNYSKIESGRMEIINGGYNLKELLGYLVNVLHSRTDPKDLEVILKIDPQLPSILSGDEVKIKQIAANLLTNAAKYTEKGSVTFEVNGKWRDSETYMLHMAVEDTGSGIKPENFANLFDSFTRFDEANHRTTEGTGLGLSITKHLVELMHGEISVKSDYGKGSRFEVYIPQRVISRAAVGEFKTEAAPAEQVKESFVAPEAKVLVVDDNKMNLSVMKLLMKRLECQTDLVGSGAECLSICREKRFDLIIMDHMMPEMDGIETLHRLKTDRGSLNTDTTVLVLTANATAGIKEEYIRQGFADYLSKPVDVSKLEKMLLKYLPAARIKRIDQTAEKPRRSSPKGGSGAIDHELGLKYCAGDEEMYTEVLRSYREQGIKYCAELPGLFSEQDFGSLAIIVHAIKSTSMTIGAQELSEQAKELEAYAKAGDGKQLAIHRDSFMLNYERVLSEASAILGEGNEPEPQEKTAVTRERYLELCRELLEKIRGFEMIEAEEAVSILNQSAFDGMDAAAAAEALSAVAKALGDFDYDGAEQALNGLIQKLG